MIIRLDFFMEPKDQSTKKRTGNVELTFQLKLIAWKRHLITEFLYSFCKCLRNQPICIFEEVLFTPRKHLQTLPKSIRMQHCPKRPMPTHSFGDFETEPFWAWFFNHWKKHHQKHSFPGTEKDTITYILQGTCVCISRHQFDWKYIIRNVTKSFDIIWALLNFIEN